MTDSLEYKIPPPYVPTDEEFRQSTLWEWNLQKDVLLTSIPVRIIVNYSIPTRFEPVPIADINSQWLPCFDKKNSEVDQWLIGKLRDALKRFPDGVFFKTDNRSPKDCGIVKLTHTNAVELPRIIFSSERMLEDLMVAGVHRKEVYFCFRKWIDIEDEHQQQTFFLNIVY